MPESGYFDRIMVTAAVPNVPYEQPDGSPYRIETDYYGKTRDPGHVTPGPFGQIGTSRKVLNVWPVPAEQAK